MAGERAVRKRLGPLGLAQAARVAAPYTIGATLLLGLLAIWRQPSMPAPAVARIAALSPAGVAAVIAGAVFVVAFLGLMDRLRRSRRRTGAVRWELYREGERPERFVEQFVVSTWDEHLRQHSGRFTVADREVEEQVQSFSDGPTEVVHLFPPETPEAADDE